MSQQSARAPSDRPGGGRPAIPVVNHRLSEEEIAAVSNVLRSESLTTGPEVAAFETELADFFGRGPVLACSSCTAALHLALLACGIGVGDEVITTPITFPATANMILAVGATPVFADVDDTLNLDPDSVDEMITDRTRAILPVHIGGNPAAMSDLLSIARGADLRVIVDAAHAIASHIDRSHVSQFGDAVCFSFYATKNITTGEGGALVGDADVMERARLLSRHGLSFAWDPETPSIAEAYEPRAAGLKYNMTDIAAAIGRVQLRRISELQDIRSACARAYDESLGQRDDILLPARPRRGEHSWYLYQVILADAETRHAATQRLVRNGVRSGAYYRPLHLYDFYRRKAKWRSLRTAEEIYPRLLALPIHARLTPELAVDIARVLLGQR